MDCKYRMLIVDDDPATLNLIRNITRHHRHFESEFLDKPTQALLKIAQNRPYHIILTDLAMPEVSGLDILRTAKAKSPDTKVLMVASFGDQQELINSIKQGLHAYIHKPFRPEELILLLNNVAERFLLLEQLHEQREEIAAMSERLEAQQNELNQRLLEIQDYKQKLADTHADAIPMDDLNQAIAKAAQKMVGPRLRYDIYRELNDLDRLLNESRITKDEFQSYRRNILERAYRQPITDVKELAKSMNR